MSNLIGQSLGRYHILEQLGEGGMAVVYKAYDTRLEADVAVKIIRTDSLPPNAIDRTLKRFEREAKALARLTHPNIVKVTDYGEHEGKPYLVMPLLSGGTLKSKLSGKPMPWQEAMRILIPIADALEYAHKHDIIHRDVKPANILITENGQPMLADFGVAKMLDVEETMELTGTGVGIGTPEYMAPEQVTGKLVDARADIYALGVVLFEMVTGRKPYIADTPMAVLIMHSRDPLPRSRQFVPDLPQAIENVIIKSLAKKPENRFQNMAEFMKAMEGVSEGKKFSAPKANEVPVHEKRVEFRFPAIPRRTVIIVGLIALGLGLLAVFFKPLSALPAQLFAASTPTFISTPSSTPMPAFTSTPGNTSTPIATNTPFLTATPTLGIGSTFTSDGMTLLYVPAGEFTIGSDTGQSDEKPVHTVYLDAYWIDQTEVTNAMYTLCVQSGECIDHSEAIHKANPDFDTSAYANPLYANYAVVYVSWKDAAAYCEWAGRKLPTEAEWEKAASWDDKTKTKRIYPWGDTIDCSFVDYYDGKNGCGGGGPVKSFESGKSPYGAYDMAGNVWEWVNDWYGKTYYQSSPSVNPLGPDSGLQRVMRGGDNFRPDNMRSAKRSAYYQGNADYTTGFRCAQSADKINTDQTPVPTATSANTPYPTTTPISLHIQPATNQGDRFTATVDGIYRFTIEKGAIRVCLSDPNLPDCGTWNSQLQVFKNRDILWGSYENRDVPRVPANLYPVRSDSMIGVRYLSTDLAVVEKVNMGRYTDIPLKKDDYLIFLPYDCQSCYGDNEGGVDISVSIVGALP